MSTFSTNQSNYPKAAMQYYNYIIPEETETQPGKNKVSTDKNNAILTINGNTQEQLQNKTVKQKLEEKFAKLFRLYNCEGLDILKTLSKIVSNSPNAIDETMQQLDDNYIEKLYKSINKAFEELYNKNTGAIDAEKAVNKAKLYYNYLNKNGELEDFDAQDNILSVNNILENTTGKSDLEKILNYFNNKLEEYKNINGNNEEKATEELKKDFYKILVQTPDSQKQLLLPVILSIIKDNNLIPDFLNSFDDEKLRTESADNIVSSMNNDIHLITSEDYNIINTIFTYTSKDKTYGYLRTLNDELRNLLETEKDTIKKILTMSEDKRNSLTGHDQEVWNKIQSNTQVITILQIAVLNNKNFNEDEVKEFDNHVIETEKQLPTYDLYLHTLAEYIGNNKTNLNIPEDKLKQFTDFLNEKTEGKYSEISNALTEKRSAYDQKTGEFKLPEPDVIAEKKQTIKELYAKFETDNDEAPRRFTVERNSSHEVASSGDTTNNSDEVETLSKKSMLFAVVNNKVNSILAPIDVDKVVDTYKTVLSMAEQFNVLAIATVRIFNPLLEATSAETKEQFLESGNTCRTFAQTKQLRESIEEDKKNDVA